MKPGFLALRLAPIVLAVAAPVTAHHSTVYFDLDTEVVHENVTVVEFRVANPHGILVYAVTDEAGNEVVWNAELPSANFSQRGGIVESMLSPETACPSWSAGPEFPAVPGNTSRV